MSIALLLIDIQNDYFPGGTMEVPGATEAATKAATLLAAFRDRSLPIIHIQHLAARPGATFFLPNTPGAEIHPSVRPLENEPVFQKHFPSSFNQTELLDYLQRENISQLLIAGMMTQMCIDTTVRAAVDFGFSCLVAHDACAARSLAFNGREVAAEDVQAAYCAALNGLFAKVLPADKLLADL
ncbi:MAG: cysteine hydrolase [Proteobacteria bacterium]|nr:cysteine hydrolase [Pseudomonadota bacterium]